MFKRQTIGLIFSLVLLFTLTVQSVPVYAANYTVAILIVDDFTGVDLSAVQAPPSQDSCAVSLEGQAFAFRGASAGAPLPKAHGDLVYLQLQEMVAKLQADAFIKLVK